MNIKYNFSLIPAIRLLYILLNILLISQLQIATAQDDLLDPAFGIHGKQLTTGGKGYNQGVFIHRLKDGKILFGANAKYGKFSYLTLTRFESTGKVDSSFGNNGIVLSDVIPPYNYGHNFQLDTLENIYIGGSSRYLYSDFRITKFNKSGKQDLTFGNQGYLYFKDVFNHGRFQIKIRNNQIYVISNLNSKSSYPFDIQKFDLDGNKDNSFGINGSIVLTESGLAKLEVTTDDKLVVAGGDDYKIVIKSYLQNGSLDSSFGQNGTAVYNDTTLRQTDEDIFLQNDQSILISGSAQIPSGYKFISRFTEHGVLDTTFANKGFLKIINGPIFPDRTHVYSDEQYITIIHGERPNSKNFITIKQYYLNGSINTFFADNGTLSLEFPDRSPWDGDAFIDKDRNILLGNSISSFSNPNHLQISFIDEAGKPKKSFGDNGQLDLFFGYDLVFSSQLLSLNGNTFIHGGSQYYGGSSKNIQLNKFTSNGIPDSSWATNGVMVPPRQRYDLENYCGAMQADGKILIAGSASVDSVTEFFTQMYVGRILPNANLDTSFGFKGVSYIRDKWYDYSFVNAIAVERDGNILIGAYTHTYPSLIRLDQNGSVKLAFEKNNIDFKALTTKILITADDKIYSIGNGYNYVEKLNSSLISKYFADGKIDTFFGDRGSIKLTIPNHSILIKSAALDQQGRIILVGTDTIQGSDSSMFACRMLPSGMIDLTFGDNGYFRFKVNNKNSASSAVLLDKQGRIYIGGTAYKTNTRDFILLCLDQDGKLINSFGDNGLVYADFDAAKDVLTSMIFDSDENIILGGNSESTEAYYMALAKVLNNLNVGTIDDTTTSEMQFIYPNPVVDQAILKFSLKNVEHVSINISDLNGKTICTLLSQKHFIQGEHQIELIMPGILMPGYYFISILTENQKRNIKFLKI